MTPRVFGAGAGSFLKREKKLAIFYLNVRASLQ
jgi:hypothetical protein